MSICLSFELVGTKFIVGGGSFESGLEIAMRI